MERNKDLHDKAWNLLEEKGLTLGQRVMVRSAFVEWSGYKDEYPFVSEKSGKFYSEIPDIKHYQFNNAQEVILANAIYENTKENFNPNDFIQMVKYTFRLINKNSEWAK